MEPRLVTPMYNYYKYIGQVINDENCDIYAMTKEHFISYLMHISGGSLNPHKLSMIYHDLMKEAGIPHG